VSKSPVKQEDQVVISRRRKTLLVPQESVDLRQIKREFKSLQFDSNEPVGKQNADQETARFGMPRLTNNQEQVIPDSSSARPSLGSPVKLIDGVPTLLKAKLLKARGLVTEECELVDLDSMTNPHSCQFGKVFKRQNVIQEHETSYLTAPDAIVANG
jgi:hypothetical protein